MSEQMESVNGTLYEYGQAGNKLYITNGDTTDWGLGVLGIPSFTIELPPKSPLTGQFFNAEEDIQPIFNENLPAMIFLIDWSIQNFSSHPQFPEWKKDILKKIKKIRSVKEEGRTFWH